MSGPFYGGQQKGGKQYQEDSFFYSFAADETVVIGGVFDGHGGQNGEIASNTARDTCIAYFQQHGDACPKWTEDEWRKRFVDLFAHLHQSIREKFMTEEKSGRYVDEGVVREVNGEPVHGGTTGTVSVCIRRSDDSCSLITANVGDSTGILIPRSGKKWQFTTVDHGPENQDEWRRINSLPASTFPKKLLFVYDQTRVFRKYECPLVFKPDGTKDQMYVANPWGNGLHPTNVRYEPAVYAVTPKSVSRDSTCIAMTRALGDFYATQFGLSCIPDVTFHTLPKDECFTICLASDGIWDCWKYEDFHQYVNDQITKTSEGTKPPKPTEKGIYAGVTDWEGTDNLADVGRVCLNESVHRAITNFGVKHYDDASLVFMPKPKFTQSSSSSSSAGRTTQDDADMDSLPPVPKLARTNTIVDMSDQASD